MIQFCLRYAEAQCEHPTLKTIKYRFILVGVSNIFPSSYTTYTDQRRLERGELNPNILNEWTTPSPGRIKNALLLRLGHWATKKESTLGTEGKQASRRLSVSWENWVLYSSVIKLYDLESLGNCVRGREKIVLYSILPIWSCFCMGGNRKPKLIIWNAIMWLS